MTERTLDQAMGMDIAPELRARVARLQMAAVSAHARGDWRAERAALDALAVIERTEVTE